MKQHVAFLSLPYIQPVDGDGQVRWAALLPLRASLFLWVLTSLPQITFPVGSKNAFTDGTHTKLQIRSTTNSTMYSHLRHQPVPKEVTVKSQQQQNSTMVQICYLKRFHSVKLRARLKEGL